MVTASQVISGRRTENASAPITPGEHGVGSLGLAEIRSRNLAQVAAEGHPNAPWVAVGNGGATSWPSVNINRPGRAIAAAAQPVEDLRVRVCSRAAAGILPAHEPTTTRGGRRCAISRKRQEVRVRSRRAGASGRGDQARPVLWHCPRRARASDRARRAVRLS
jgi:hypothetical protein